MNISYFSSATVSRLWDFFDGLPFHIKTRILILGTIYLIAANYKKSDSMGKLLDFIFDDEIKKESLGVQA